MLRASGSAHAQLTIEIIGGGATTIPIAIVPFAGESNYPLGISGIVGADLSRSGLFRLVDPGGVVPRPARAEDVRYGDWTGRGADAVVVGSMTALPDGRAEVRFALLDAVKQAQLASFSYVVPPAQFRATAHRIADVIYEKLTGDIGVFSTRIAYIAKQGARYELLVADADGYNPQSIVTSKEPLLSPEWSPDGTPHRLRLDGEQEAGRLRAVADHRGAAAGRQLPRQQQRAGVVARRQQARGDAVQGRQLADLPDQRRRRQCAAPDHVGRHRHRGELRARRAVDTVHLGSRRQPADLSPDA